MHIRHPPQVKILHVVENLHRGSVERWLLRIFLHGRRTGRPFDWTFYCVLPEHGALEDEAMKAGVRIAHSPAYLADKVAFLFALRREVQRGGYDVIHSHHDFMSAAYYWASIGCGCHRITHVHNTDEALPTRSRLKRGLALEFMRRTCVGMSDGILGSSDHALRQFLRSKKPDPRHRVHYCSIDLEACWSEPFDREGLRAELAMAQDTKLLLFVGSLIDLKNPVFVIEMLAHMLQSDARIAAIFVGHGPEEARVVRRAQELCIADRVRVLGWREDVLRLMQASDLFVNPRRENPMEALGIVNIEAQAAGLRTIISDGISPEAMLAGTLHVQIPLAAGAAEWARKGLELLRQPPLPLAMTKQLFRGSRFDPDFAVQELHGIYAEMGGA